MHGGLAMASGVALIVLPVVLELRGIALPIMGGLGVLVITASVLKLEPRHSPRPASHMILDYWTVAGLAIGAAILAEESTVGAIILAAVAVYQLVLTLATRYLRRPARLPVRRQPSLSR
jgi:hypothetical protein